MLKSKSHIYIMVGLLLLAPAAKSADDEQSGLGLLPAVGIGFAGYWLGTRVQAHRHYKACAHRAYLVTANRASARNSPEIAPWYPQAPTPRRLYKMQQHDLEEIQRIENLAFEFPLTREELEQDYRNPNLVNLIIRQNGHVASYISFELSADGISIHNLAVDPKLRQQGLGTEILRRGLLQVASPGTKVRVLVRESNQSMLRMLRKSGFTSAQLVHAPWNGVEEDGIQMELTFK